MVKQKVHHSSYVSVGKTTHWTGAIDCEDGEL